MAKIERHKDEKGKEFNINLETGDVNESSAPKAEAWSTSLSNSFVKVCSIVEQIKVSSINLIDETTLNTIAHSLVPFGDKGKNLLDQVCLFQNTFATDQINEAWNEALRRSKAKNANTFLRLCKTKGIEAKLKEDVWEYKMKDPGRAPYLVTDDLLETESEDISQWGYLEKNNCYYFAEYDMAAGICTLTRKSNFVLRILFHINRGKQNKRVIELINIKGRKVTTDIETKQLTGFQQFKELTEGAGNFIFEGSQIELLKIKNKLFEEERPSIQIDMLGWNKAGKFFAFSNGVYNSQFNPVDEHGIVTLYEKNYFIPYHPLTDEYSNMNEKLFCYKPGTTSFETWAETYCESFGNAGKVAILFGIATLFSDHIFSVRRNFPMLFLYGEGGSGKSRVGVYLQYLCGEPQPPLKLSDRANTDKARIRKMAQYVNAMAVFEEFINELEMNIIKTITGIYDRFGYERSNINSMYGTETVPINSTAFITGNSYPNDDPLMQRIILIDYNSNVRDEKTVASYNKLTQINREGITHLTGQLIQFRPYFIEHYEKEFDLRFAEFKKLCADQKIVVPDRMCENYALILTTYEVISGAGVKLPFMAGELKKFMLSTIRAQADKRDVGSVTQRFWDIVQQLASEGAIRHEKEFKFDGNVLSIRWTEIHGMYMEKHQRLYRSPGLGKSTMLQKLRDSGHMITDGGDKERFEGKVCHSYKFVYDKLGIDLMAIVEYWAARERKYAPKEEAKQGSDGPEKVTDVTKSYSESQNDISDQNAENSAQTNDVPF
ncbi:hypothetical protein WSM22_03110 [Cytophagales bacterium WSM2-2]|nr:hypothetical protein WSM22_03110 [Cytophagales bacterium WSM2-2]